MAITDISISEELMTNAPSIKYRGKEGPKSPQEMEMMMVDALLDEEYEKYIYDLLEQRPDATPMSKDEFRRMIIGEGMMSGGNPLPEDPTKPVNPFAPKPTGPTLPNRQMAAYGGIMGLDGRKQYGIGSYFQELKDKIFDNPVATAAAAYLGYDTFKNRGDLDESLIGKGLNLIAKPFKSVGKFVGDIFVKIGNKIMGWVDDALKWVDDAIKGILNAGANAFPKIANAINQGKTFAGNLLNKGKNFIKNVGGNILNRGKNIVKNVGGGVSKWIGKLFGKNAAKAAAGPGIKTLFKSLAKGAKAIKIPVVGPLLVALMSMFAGDPIGQTLFKTAGAAIGGGLGLALGPIGMFVGEIAGEFVGDVLYEGFMGKDGWAGAGQKLKEKFMQILEGGKKVVKWIAGGIGRYVKNIITTDPITIPEGGGRRAVATRVTKFLGLYDWLKTEGFAGGKDGQIDKFPNFLNVLFPWKSAKILVKSFFPPGEGSEEGETSASIGPQESNSDAEAVSESASYEDGGEEPTTIVDGGGEETAAAPASEAGKGGFIPIQIGQSQDTLNILTNATLYKV